MNREQHIRRHKELHRALDELFADYIKNHPEQHEFIEMPVRDLIDWSYQQTVVPTDPAEAGK